MDERQAQRNRRAPGVGAEEAAGVLAGTLESLITVWGRAQEAFGTTVSPTQLRALTIIHRARGISLHGLAQEMGTVSSVASRLCDRLDSAGLVTRDLDAHNRRKVVVALTSDGESLMDAIRARRAEDLVDTLGRMPAADRAALVAGMEAFRRAAGHPAHADSDTGEGVRDAPSRRFA
ncbi:MarR family winged helix-turn-helix transcriptional regulator [Yinghuangia seranimata]|uniref:MarR family winged helix-turn-helix transcriptional regulator n=1 Tax=Yinghuangia seranimata TaxID=408067 RepID=UPI00248C6EC0|nr:MarR family transcriptional regulator [Yinghuangia seranimata]MDI2125038.1 MarR family transcriptional regulator [Yinghuangia seranimata]